MFGRRVSGDTAGSLNSAAALGGTREGEDGVGVEMRTYLGLGTIAARLGFGQIKVSSVSLDSHGKHAFHEFFPLSRCLG